MGRLQLSGIRGLQAETVPFKELLSSVPGKQQRSGLQPVKLELRQGFVTKMSAPVAGNMWTPAMAFATWHVLAGPSSQYGHPLCCIQEQNRNQSGWGRAKALNHVSVDGLHQAGAEVWTLLPWTPAWDPPLSRASGFCSRLETTG